MSKFKFDLKAKVTNSFSGESGTVIGRTDSVDEANSYRVEHIQNGSGRMVSIFWYERHIKLTPVVKAVVKKKAAPAPAVKKAVTKKRAVKSSAPQPA